MPVVVNYIDELIDKTLDETLEDKLKRRSKISPQKLVEEGRRLSEKHTKSLSRDIRDRISVFLVRYFVTYYVLHEALVHTESGKEDLRGLSGFLVSVQSIQDESYVTPLIVNSIITNYILALKLIRFFETGRHNEEVDNFIRDLNSNRIIEEIKKQIKDDEYHSFIKLLIFRNIYVIHDKWNIQTILEINTLKDDSVEYVYIDVIEAITEHVNSQVFADEGIEEASDYVSLLEESIKSTTEDGDAVSVILKYLFKYKWAIPVTHDFSRYHTQNPTRMNVESGGTRLTGILHKVQTSRNYELAEKNQLFFAPKKNLLMIDHNFFDELHILDKNCDEFNRIRYNVNDQAGLQELLVYRYQHNFDFIKPSISYTTSSHIVAARSANIIHPVAKGGYDLRYIRPRTDVNLYGLIVVPDVTYDAYINRLKCSPSLPLTTLTYKKVIKFAEKNWRSKSLLSDVQFLKLESGEKTLSLLENLYDLAKKIQYERVKEVVSKDGRSLVKKRHSVFKSVDFLTENELLSLLIWYDGRRGKNLTQTDASMKPFDTGDIPRESNQTLYTRCVHNVKPVNNHVFVQRYASLDEDGNIICKSCGEGLENILHRIGDVSIDESSGDFVITSIVSNVSVYEKREYAPFINLIKDIHRFIKFRLSRVFQFPMMRETDFKSVKYQENIIDETIKLIQSHNSNLHLFVRDSAGFSILSDGMQVVIRDNTLRLTPSTTNDNIRNFNGVILYLVVQVLVKFSESDIVYFSKPYPTGVNCPLNSFTKHTRMFEELPIGDGRLSDMPLLCFLLSHAACLLQHYGLYIDTTKDKQKSLKVIICTMADILQRIMTPSLNSDTDKSLQGRFRLNKKNMYSNRKVLDKILGVSKSLVTEWRPLSNNIKAKDSYQSRLYTRTYYLTKKLAMVGDPIIRPIVLSPPNKNTENELANKLKITENLVTIYRAVPRILLPTATTTSKIPIKKTQIRSIEKVIAKMAELLGDAFSVDKGSVDHDYKGLPQKPYTFDWQKKVTTEKLDGRECFVIDAIDTKAKVYYDAQYYFLVGYKIGNSSTLYKKEGAHLYLTYIPSLKKRILNSLEDPTLTMKDVAYGIVCSRVDVGMEEAIQMLIDNSDKKSIDKGKEFAVERKRKEKLQHVRSFFLNSRSELLKLMSKKIELPDNPEVYTSGDYFACILDMIDLSLDKASLKRSDVLELLDRIIKDVKRPVLSIERVLQRVVYSPSFSVASSSFTTDAPLDEEMPLKQNPLPPEILSENHADDGLPSASHDLEEMIADIDMEGEVFETEGE